MRIQFKQLSLLGLALMGASTIVAMINSTKEKKVFSDVQLNGRIQYTTGGPLISIHHTCVATLFNENCHYTKTHDNILGPLFESSTSSRGTGSISFIVGNRTGSSTTFGG